MSEDIKYQWPYPQAGLIVTERLANLGETRGAVVCVVVMVVGYYGKGYHGARGPAQSNLRGGGDEGGCRCESADFISFQFSDKIYSLNMSKDIKYRSIPAGRSVDSVTRALGEL